ncbi:MAG TPA: ABC transporter permease subunit [Verrucomicrobiae bacterium]|nr:ABC transporter permease subunit [Verrucomicrobiae bacterium]
MLLLPIVDRELRVAARNRRTYLMRVAAGGCALAMSLYLIWVARYAMGGAGAGMFILKATSYIAWALAVFTGVNRTCDSLSSEKRSDTLGLLFLTHLRGYDVVLGKLLANSVSAFFLLLGIVPVLGVPVLLGGVSGAEMIRIPMALVNSLFLALSLGLLVSALVRGQRAASFLAGGGIVVLAVVLPVLAQLADRELQWPELASLLRVFSPLYAQEMSFSSSIGLSTNYFWTAILVQFLMGGVALAGACLILPYSWKIHPAGGRWLALQEKATQWIHGSPEARLQRRVRLLARNPFYWLGCRDRFGALWPMLFALLALSTVGWCIVHYDIPKEPACGLLFAALGINDLATRMRVASIAAGRLAEDRQSGALEMILSTPFSVREVIQGQWMVIRHLYLRTYIPMLVFYLLVGALFLGYVQSSSKSWMIVFFFVLISAGDFVVTGYVAMWKGLRVNNPRNAPGAALVRILIVPWFLWLGLMPLIHEVKLLRQWFDSGEPYTFLGTALLIWGISSVTAFRRARRNLRLHFREAATDRYLFEQKVSFFGRFHRSRQQLATLFLLRSRRPAVLS